MTGTHSEIVGVILAAGKGTRIRQLPSTYPKPVLPILGAPLIYYQLRMIAELGIKRVLIVVGYLSYEIVRHVERIPELDLEIDYVEQEDTLGIAHSLGKLEPLLNGPLLVLLGDIYLDAPHIHKMLDVFSEPSVDCVLGATEECDYNIIRKNYCMVTDRSGYVTRVIEKPRYPKSKLKGVGLYLFSNQVFDAIRRTPRTAIRDEYEITDSIQIMIDDGYKIKPSLCIKQDMNITYPYDLWDINMRLLNKMDKQRVIDESVVLGDDVTIEKSVIGRGGIVGDGATIVKSVVFPEVVVEKNTVIENTILCPNGHYIC